MQAVSVPCGVCNRREGCFNIMEGCFTFDLVFPLLLLLLTPEVLADCAHIAILLPTLLG